MNDILGVRVAQSGFQLKQRGLDLLLGQLLVWALLLKFA
jgi:hypothetical protein